MHALQKILPAYRNFLQLVWEILDAFCCRYSPLDASCRCYSLHGSETTLDWAPWKGADGGLRIFLVLHSPHNYDYSMTPTIGSDTIQRSARAGTIVTGLFITLAGAPCTIPYFIRLFLHYAVLHPIIPALCQLRERAYYAQNYAGIIAASLIRTHDQERLVSYTMSSPLLTFLPRVTCPTRSCHQLCSFSVLSKTQSLPPLQPCYRFDARLKVTKLPIYIAIEGSRTRVV